MHERGIKNPGCKQLKGKKIEELENGAREVTRAVSRRLRLAFTDLCYPQLHLSSDNTHILTYP